VWLGASLLLDRPVSVHEPYPHICHYKFRSATGRTVTVERRDCGGCGDVWAARAAARAAEAATETTEPPPEAPGAP
jgi:hypothetical protein